MRNPYMSNLFHPIIVTPKTTTISTGKYILYIYGITQSRCNKNWARIR